MATRPTYGSYPADRSVEGSSPAGGRISGVEPGSPADRANIRSGDVVVAAGERELTDVIAWWWESDGSSVSATIASPKPSAEGGEEWSTRQVTLTRDPGEPWGIEFADTLFDGVRTCANRCSFCFMAQLPRGLRRALYLRDDDYRLSFLAGNFVTLTNLTNADAARIVTEHLSPLYVSLHAVSPQVRAELVCAREDRALERFDELVEAGIDLHVQIVLVPGVNDGPELDRTLRWLAEREGILSVGIVPLGYTAHQERFASSYEDPADSAAVLDSIEPWASAMRERDGIGWVYAADEFYLNAGRELPPADAYDGFPQYENGIGLVRTFIDEFESVLGGSKTGTGTRTADAHSATVGPDAPDASATPLAVTGTLFAPVLAEALAQAGLAERVTLVPVANRFFGGNVSVTGLLAGRDIADALASAVRPDPARPPAGAPASVASSGASHVALIPVVIFNDDGLTLDDMTADDIAAASGTVVRVVGPDAAGLLSGIL